MKSENKELDQLFTKMMSGDSRFRWSEHHQGFQALPEETKAAWNRAAESRNAAFRDFGKVSPEELVGAAAQRCSDSPTRIICLRLMAANCSKDYWPLRDAARAALRRMSITGNPARLAVATAEGGEMITLQEITARLRKDAAPLLKHQNCDCVVEGEMFRKAADAIEAGELDNAIDLLTPSWSGGSNFIDAIHHAKKARVAK